MARKAPKMTDLVIEETSGVDHPAHLHEGWLVVKASNAEDAAAVLNSLPNSQGERMSEETAPKVVEDAYDAGTDEMPNPEMKTVEEDLAMALARIQELEARIAELESADAAEPAEPADMAVEESLVSLAKSAPEPLRKALETLLKEKQAAESTLLKEREDRADADAIVKARETFSHLNIEPEKIGPALRRLAVIDGELAKSVETALLSADAQNESADIFNEVGKSGGMIGDAIEKMSSLAKAAVAEGKAATYEQAMAHVASSNPALYSDYLNEKGA